jgi:hypothetical protein
MTGLCAGGRGFASALASRYPVAQSDFVRWASRRSQPCRQEGNAMTERDEQRLEDAITFLISRAPKALTRTALLTLLYFADLRSYELRRRPVTALNWLWHF